MPGVAFSLSSSSSKEVHLSVVFPARSIASRSCLDQVSFHFNMNHTRANQGTPQVWMDPQMQQSPSMNTYNMNNMSGQFQYNGQMEQLAPGRSSSSQEIDELIPTAIVIKNIPFAVKKEQLCSLMQDMGLPIPYAFNYHFDQGVFRGLAFANFTNPEDTKAVIQTMNHMELQGRKLRVEYKKMLPAEERERIERDKREKRGQLQEQHQPIPPGQQIPNPLHPQTSMTSIGSAHHPPTSPSPVSMRGNTEGEHTLTCTFTLSNLVPLLTSIVDKINLNDPTTLGYYNELMLFKNTESRETLIFPSSIPPPDRRIIHILAHNMGLEHRSEGQGEARYVQILKRGAAHTPPVPQPQNQFISYDSRRQLNRAATIDFSETREAGGYHSSHTLGRQSSDYLGVPGSPGGHPVASNLRTAKSFADLRSYTPSPVPSTASFPAGLTQNISRYTDYGHSSAASGTPNLTPTSASAGMNAREDNFLSNGMSSLSMYDRPSANRSGRIGQERETHTPSAGAIGSQRPNGNSSNYEENPRNGTSTVAERQPRGPGNDWGAGSGGFRPRQNGHANRGSGELDLHSFDINSWDNNTNQDSSDRNGSSSRYM